MLYDKGNWVRSRAQRALPVDDIRRLVDAAFPGSSVVSAQAFAGGLANSNYKLHLHGCAHPIVLRIYDREPAACWKEVDIYRMICGTVPVPEILHAEPAGLDGIGPFVVMQYVEGLTLRELKASRETPAIRQAAQSVGKTLAAIGRYTFSMPGWLGSGPSVTGGFGFDSPGFVESCLDSRILQGRMESAAMDRVRRQVWSWAERLALLDQDSRLVHCDLNSPNILVRAAGGRWIVAAVLDWEFAVSGSPILDVGNFLRYEHESRPRFEPYFSLGYAEAGGKLPDDWRTLARILDLTSLCEILTRDALPKVVKNEVIELIQATIDEDPAPAC
ncbi:MAG: phosphotransferase family protein [Blastocatellia bacterium]